VRDFEKRVSFYRDKMGFKLENEEADFAYFTFGTQGGPGLALLPINSAVNLISEARFDPKRK